MEIHVHALPIDVGKQYHFRQTVVTELRHQLVVLVEACVML